MNQNLRRWGNQIKTWENELNQIDDVSTGMDGTSKVKRLIVSTSRVRKALTNFNIRFYVMEIYVFFIDW